MDKPSEMMAFSIIVNELGWLYHFIFPQKESKLSTFCALFYKFEF